MKENETEREGEREGGSEGGDFCCWWFDMMMRFRGYTIQGDIALLKQLFLVVITKHRMNELSLLYKIFQICFQ